VDDGKIDAPAWMQDHEGRRFKKVLVCPPAWLLNKTINPLTGRHIRRDKSVYRSLERACIREGQIEAPQLKRRRRLRRSSQERKRPAKTCLPAWLANPTVNPQTGRSIQPGKSVYRKLQRACMRAGLVPTIALSARQSRSRSRQLPTESYALALASLDEARRSSSPARSPPRRSRRRLARQPNASSKSYDLALYHARLPPPPRSARRSRESPSDSRQSKEYLMAIESLKSGRDVIDRYEKSRFKTMQVLGAGTYGEVSLVRDIKTGRDLVIKKMLKAPDNPEASFEIIGTELVALRKLHSICRDHLVCYDGFFEDEENYYITSEYLGKDMITLQAYLEKRRDTMQNRNVDREREIKIAKSLIRSLSAIHAAGIAHRDLKPDNILVSQQTGDVRYIDFGLACWDGECERSFTTGTTWYSSPEQMESKLGIGEPSADWTLARFKSGDVYALGLILFELFTGNPIFLIWNGLVPGITPEQFAREFDFNGRKRKDLTQKTAATAQDLFASHGINLSAILDRNPNTRLVI
jgi:hypothetical protein